MRADPPGNAIDAAATAILSELPMLSGWSEEARQRFAETLAVVTLAAAAPVIAAQAARDERQAIIALIERHIAAQGWGPNSDAVARVLRKLADLLRGAETTGDER